ncbi:hypothetical protein [Luteimonas arsenica]|uniref:hypothetical protein n=1 Tax=Luteimonas arsenica TaxID=1586242 RepID=UPI001FB5F015|nr:hypothetical protein [Luteimonas arsenica]
MPRQPLAADRANIRICTRICRLPGISIGILIALPHPIAGRQQQPEHHNAEHTQHGRSSRIDKASIVPTCKERTATRRRNTP